MRRINFFDSKPFHFILFLAICFSFSCNVSVDIIKKKYRPGFYFAYSTKKSAPACSPVNEAADTLQKKHIKFHSAVVADKADSIVSGSTKVTFFSKHAMLSKKKQRENNKDHALASNSSSKEKIIPFLLKKNNIAPLLRNGDEPKKKLNGWYKLGLFCLLIALLGVLIIMAAYAVAAVGGPIMTIGNIIVEPIIFGRFFGVIFAFIGWIKARKDPVNTDAAPPRLDIFSRIALWCAIIGFISLPFIGIGIILLFASKEALLAISLTILFGMFCIGWVSSLIGMVQSIKKANKSRRNVIKSILISLLNWVPLILIAVLISALAAAFAAFINGAIAVVAFLLVLR